MPVGFWKSGSGVEEARTAFSDLRCCLLDVHALHVEGDGKIGRFVAVEYLDGSQVGRRLDQHRSRGSGRRGQPGRAPAANRS